VIEQNLAEYEHLRTAASNSPLRQRLRAKGLIK